MVKKNYDNMLSQFHLVGLPERHGQTDGRMDRRTDRFAISISRVSVLTCDKNLNKERWSPREVETGD